MYYSHFVSLLCSITKVIMLLAIDAILLKKKSEKPEGILCKVASLYPPFPSLLKWKRESPTAFPVAVFYFCLFSYSSYKGYFHKMLIYFINKCILSLKKYNGIIPSQLSWGWIFLAWGIIASPPLLHSTNNSHTHILLLNSEHFWDS